MERLAVIFGVALSGGKRGLTQEVARAKTTPVFVVSHI